MESNIIKVAEILDSSDKVEEKLQVVDICYDIMETIHDGSRQEDVKTNVLIIEKIVENIVNKLEQSKVNSMDAESFIKIIYNYLYKSNILVTPDALLKMKIIENYFSEKIEHSSYVNIIDSFDDLDLLEKTCLSVVYKQYSGFLASGAYRLFGPQKCEEIIDEFKPKSLEILSTSLDEAMIDDEMTIDDLVDELHSKFAKISKDIYLNKYKAGELDLNKCLLSTLYAGKAKKDIIPIFISDIYERTAFINEEDSDNEFVKDCCDLLNISPEEYKKDILYVGKVSQLQLTRLLRKINFKEDEE